MDQIEQLIADNFKVKRSDLQNIQLIGSFYFSDELFDEMSAFLSAEKIEKLRDSKDKIGLDALDSIFIYKLTLSGKDIFAVVYDHYELYLPTFIWETFEA
ncbi:hypothetical protein D0C36_16345 [Mucilaginibacter conchicola]|uniref:Uncharacterized protein n=1 Tax=Mucilaginibacter conchicola TaxID=2303333 RepID=A0A372NWE4_9SPHI|nr:hypothetical protein [Mucilaginibacter conchicola]RFZ92957.1 hypothetical protein D0C36_16345 [Mucilaginibacter conchicola]